MSSTFLILCMTFERFYSIIKPHKAASFNTAKRAKITIASFFILFNLFNLPHLFISDTEGLQCVPWGRGSHLFGQIYYYLETVIAFVFPFVALLAMNCVIIYTLRARSFGISKSEGHEQVQVPREGQVSKIKSSEKQTYVTLLTVTFSFLLLTTPLHIMNIYAILVGAGDTPYSMAKYYLIYQSGEKSYYTNYAINFFLYVMSGKKFRAYLVRLFTWKSSTSGN